MILFLSGCFSSSSSSTSTGEWTIMVYLDGDDSILESYALTDFNEMEKGLYDAVNSGDIGITDRINVIVMVDRYEGGVSNITESGGTDWSDTRLYRIKPDDNMSYFGSERLDDGSSSFSDHTSSLGEKNMADPSTLSDFIDYSKEYFPADHYAIILWNHGGAAQKKSTSGPTQPISKSICWDGDNGNDTLYIDELQQALEENFDASDRLDIIGFDACLMATIEVAYEIRNLADYMVGSMNIIQANGWSYDTILGGIINQAETGEELAVYMAQTYKQYIDETDSAQGYGETISVTDLSTLDDLATKVDALGKAIADENKQTELETLREETFNYYDIDHSDTNYYSVLYPYYDLHDLCERINTDANFSAALQTSANDVITALSETIVYSYGDESDPGNTGQTQTAYNGYDTAKGLSIFFSRGDKVYNAEPHYHYQWWYTNENTAIETGVSDNLYGFLDFCTSNEDGEVDGWRELMEFWYDNPDSHTPSTY